jgi:ribosomal protein S17E
MSDSTTPLVLKEVRNDDPSLGKLLSNFVLDGLNNKKLENGRLIGRPSQNPDEYVPPMDEAVVRQISSNASKAMGFFASPTYPVDDEHHNLSKIIAVGKVQSGKTGFFVSCIAMAFDNKYRLVFLIGGTKEQLRDQNERRIKREFANNDRVVVYNLDNTNTDTVREDLCTGKNVIIVVLKNAAQTKNLGALSVMAEAFKDIPTLVVDDEGDEFSPGAPHSKSGRTMTHEYITQTINTPLVCTYLAVTATPQANFLISTPDPISPDYCVLVPPGKGYIGGSYFHDSLANPHVMIVNDEEEFEASTPQSFSDALHYFIMAVSLKMAFGDKRPYSMLVNPSRLTRVHRDIVDKILSRIRLITDMLRPSNSAYDDELKCIEHQYDLYVRRINPNCAVTFDQVAQHVPEAVEELAAFEFNATFEGQLSQQAEKQDKRRYKIYVGGSMLGRGLTIRNLIVTYIYNDSKQTAVDTLYQRARWLGYKASYFDVCRVYLTQSLQEKLIAIVNSETDMWDALSNFLDTKTDIKKFPRIFTLDTENNKLVLTRRTISKTVKVERMLSGYSFDTTIGSLDERKENLKLAEDLFDKYKPLGQAIQVGVSQFQKHYVIRMKITDLYDDFLGKYHVPPGASIGPRVYSSLREQAARGDIPDEIYLIFMRYQTGETRSTISGGRAIAQLPQGPDPADGSNYPGDRYMDPYSKELHLQIHNVYLDGNRSAEPTIFLGLNNPITTGMIKQFVTGENVYEC